MEVFYISNIKGPMPGLTTSPFTVACHVNLPTISVTDSPLHYVDITVSCTKGAYSLRDLIQ